MGNMDLEYRGREVIAIVISVAIGIAVVVFLGSKID